MFRTTTLIFVLAAAGSAWDSAGEVTTDSRIAQLQKLGAANLGNLRTQLQLAAAYIQKTRETSDFGYLDRAERMVNHVLVVSASDYEALGLRNLIELNRHHFTQVVESARRMTEVSPADPGNWGVLGDALMELGRYEEAGQAYGRMLRPTLFSYNRIAWFRFVTGDVPGAIAAMTQAATDSRGYPENRSWCMVELGNLYFKTGRVEEAERSYALALSTFPSHAAHAGMGAALAAQDRIAGAIESYRRAQAVVPAPQYAAALVDLYEALGDTSNARHQREMVDMSEKLERAANQRANRTLALIFANENRQLGRALELAKADLEFRQDIYTWDAMAWTLYRNKQYAAARGAAAKALGWGTPEPLFHYHAGMIALAMGDAAEAARHLEAALRLNPRFDFGQWRIARKALDSLRAN